MTTDMDTNVIIKYHSDLSLTVQKLYVSQKKDIWLNKILKWYNVSEDFIEFLNRKIYKNKYESNISPNFYIGELLQLIKTPVWLYEGNLYKAHSDGKFIFVNDKKVSYWDIFVSHGFITTESNITSLILKNSSYVSFNKIPTGSIIHQKSIKYNIEKLDLVIIGGENGVSISSISDYSKSKKSVVLNNKNTRGINKTIIDPYDNKYLDFLKLGIDECVKDIYNNPNWDIKSTFIIRELNQLKQSNSLNNWVEIVNNLQDRLNKKTINL